MKNYYLLLCLIFLAPGVANSQWTQINSGTGQILSDIKFVNDSTGFISGCGSTLLKTTDYGLSWNAIATAPSGNLKDLFFINEQTGFVVVDNTICRTSNGGVNWAQVKDFSGETPGGIYFTSATVGFAITSIYGPPGGSFIYNTTDGGNTWIKTDSMPTVPTLQDIEFIGTDTGFVVGYAGKVFRTYDGGQNWTLGVSSTTETLYAASFISSTEGYVAGYSSYTGGIEVNKTTNAAQSWTGQFSGGTTNAALRGLHFPVKDTGYACGDNGRIIATYDGGLSWNVQYSGVTSMLNAVLFISPQTGFAIGANGTILRTDVNTGVKNNDIPHFRIYPNPANANVIVDAPMEGVFYLIDLQGKEIMKQKCYGETDISLSAIQKGMYIVKIVSENFSSSGKLIID